MTTGTCKHGSFILREGCPQCIEERQIADKEAILAAEAEEIKAMQAKAAITEPNLLIVKVQYLSLSTGEISPREYTYYSEDRLSVGDIVTVPVRDTTTKARVSAIDVSESEIASFRDKVKVIPAGSVVPVFPAGGLAEAAQMAGAEVTVVQATFTLEPDMAELTYKSVLEPTVIPGTVMGESGAGVTPRIQEIDADLARLQANYEKTLAEPQGARPPAIQKDRLAGITNQMDKLEAERAKLVEEPLEIDTKINLCDTCTLRNDYPVCCQDITFGDGRGNDNIIQCSKHSEGPAKPCSIPLNEEARQDVEEELIASHDVIQIDPERQQDYIALKKEVEKAIPYAESRVITTMEHAKLASNDLVMIAKLTKAIEDRRVEYVKPLNDYVAEFNMAFKKLSEPLKEAKRVTDQKILAFQHQVADERRLAEQAQAIAIAEAQRKAQEIKETTGEIIEVEPEKVELPPAPTTRVRTDFGLSSQVDNWKYHIVDVTLIPRKYFKLDEVYIGKAVRAGERDIPGIEIYNEPILRTR